MSSGQARELGHLLPPLSPRGLVCLRSRLWRGGGRWGPGARNSGAAAAGLGAGPWKETPGEARRRPGLWSRCPWTPDQRTGGRAGAGTCSARPGRPRGVCLGGPALPAPFAISGCLPLSVRFLGFSAASPLLTASPVPESARARAVASAATSVELVALRRSPEDSEALSMTPWELGRQARHGTGEEAEGARARGCGV